VLGGRSGGEGGYREIMIFVLFVGELRGSEPRVGKNLGDRVAFGDILFQNVFD
jgi:hypothetical protein